jgi:hypothetical protein
MNKKILLPLGRYDRSEAMIPFIEKVVRPGMKVIFLMPYPVDEFTWAKEEYGVRAALAAKKLVRHYSWEGNLERAREKVAPACEALRARGIEASVEVYAGCLKKAVRSHVSTGDVHLVVTRSLGYQKPFDGIAFYVRAQASRLSSGVSGSSECRSIGWPSCRGFFKQPAPVLLVQARVGVGARKVL